MRAHAFEGVLGTLQPSIVRFCYIAAQQLASLAHFVFHLHL